MRLLAQIAALILAVHLGLMLYTNRALFLSSFDATYWKDKYEHSQWKLPLSQRTIGDDGLYLYEGYRLTQGEDPTLLNAEVPPLGKYIIGATVRLFNNGHVYGLLVYMATLVVFFLLSKQILPSASWALIATALLGLDPLLTSQTTLTMLDNLQLLFLLVFFLFLVRKSHPALLGLSVGLFAETKFGILAPLLMGIGVLSLLQRPKRNASIGIFVGAAAVSYLLPYTQYFLLGHTPIDWLHVQKWIVSFYMHSNLLPTYGSAAVALLTGWAQNIFSRGWEAILEWSPVWPAVSMLAAATFWRNRKTLGPLGLFFLATMLFYLIIPFWTRYLLLILPFCYLGAARGITKLSARSASLIMIVLLLLNGAASLRIHLPTPENTVRQFTYEWEHGFFQDMYESLTHSARQNTTRENFRNIGLTAYHEAEIEHVQIVLNPSGWSRTQTKQEIPLTVAYKTRNLGSFEEARTLTVLKEDGRWRIAWNWNVLIDGFTPSHKFITTLDPAIRGSIVGGDKKPVSYDFPSALINIVPGEVDHAREEEMLGMIEQLFNKNITAVAFHQRYVGNALPNLPVSLAILGRPLTQEEQSRLLSFPGLSLAPAIGRYQGTSALTNVGFVANTTFGECCSSLYSTTTYDGYEGIEKNFNAQLKGYHGGTLTLVDTDGSAVRTLITQEKQNGQDVDLLSTFKTP